MQLCQKFRIGLEQAQLEFRRHFAHRFSHPLVLGVRREPLLERRKFDALQPGLVVVIRRVLLHTRITRLQEEIDEAVDDNQRQRDDREIRAAQTAMQRHNQQIGPPAISERRL